MTAKELFEHQPFTDHVVYLWSRWHDEKEYEDFAEYKAALAKQLPAGWSLLKMTSRPFAFQVRDEAGDIWAFKLTMGRYSYSLLSKVSAPTTNRRA